MTDTTYRIGGAVPPTVCMRHGKAPVTFQCQECLDSLCDRCRAPGQNRCRLCHQALKRAAKAPAGAQAPRAGWRAAIAGWMTRRTP